MTIWVKNEKNSATKQAIREKEIALGVTLPIEYKQLLSEQMVD